MEGISPGILLCGLAYLLLGSVSLLLLVASIGLFLANRFNQKLFAVAVFCGLMVPVFLILSDISQPDHRLLCLTCVACFLLAATGQLIAAYRGNYPTAFWCSLASAAFQYGFVNGYFETQLRMNLFVVPSVLLAIASVFAALNPPPRVHIALKLLLINLVLLDLAVIFYTKASSSIHPERDGSVSLKYQLIDVTDNTHWDWVLAAAVLFVPATVGLLTYKPKLTRRRFLAIAAIVLFLTAQWITGNYGSFVLGREISLAAGPYVFDDFIPYSIAPGWIRCNYVRGKWDWQNPKAVDPNPQFFKDDFFWYGFGQVRLRHIELTTPEKNPFKGWPGFRVERPASRNLGPMPTLGAEGPGN